MFIYLTITRNILLFKKKNKQNQSKKMSDLFEYIYIA